MVSVENAGGASPLEEVVVPRASPGIDDMLDAAAEPPARHVRRISDSEAVDTAAAAIAMAGGNDSNADADANANGGAADDGDDIRPSGSGTGTSGGDNDKDSDRANRGVEAILQVAASADEEDEAAATDAPKSVGPLRPRPHRPAADGGSGGGGNNRPKEGKGGPQRAPPPQRPGMPPPPPPGGYPGPSGAYHHPYGPPPYFCEYDYDCFHLACSILYFISRR